MRKIKLNHSTALRVKSLGVLGELLAIKALVGKCHDIVYPELKIMCHDIVYPLRD